MKKIISIAILSLLIGCATNPPIPTPEQARQTQINACLPNAIMMCEGLKNAKVDAKVLSMETPSPVGYNAFNNFLGTFDNGNVGTGMDGILNVTTGSGGTSTISDTNTLKLMANGAVEPFRGLNGIMTFCMSISDYSMDSITYTQLSQLYKSTLGIGLNLQ